MPARSSRTTRTARSSPRADQSAPSTQSATTDSTWGPAALAGQAASGEWSLEEVRTFLEGYALIPKRLEAEPLPGGWENLNLKLDVDGQRYVLRRYDSTEPAEVPWELELLTFLAARDFPTPAPLRRPDGALLADFRGRPAALFPFVEGRHPKWDEPDAPIVAAEAIGRLNQLTDGLSLPHPHSRQEAHTRLKRYQEWLASRPPAAEDEPLREFAKEATRHEAEFLRRLETVERTLGPLPRGVVHFDAHGNNLLVDPHDARRLIALLDFDDAHESLLLIDVCSLVDVWGLDRGSYEFDPIRARCVLEVYTALRPLAAAERELFPDVLALVNLAGTTAYVMGRVMRGTDPAQAIADCGQYKSYRRRTAGPAWRETLREVFLG